MIKKFISGILTVIIICSMFNFAIAEESAVTDYNSEKSFLEQIGIKITDIDGVSRGEFIKILLDAFYPSDIFLDDISETPVFSDVSATHPYYSQIKAAKDMKIIRGNGDGSFRPDEKITLSEAVVMVSNALGYTVYGEEKLNMAFYHNIARQKNVLKDISADFYGKLEIPVMYKLIFNALSAELVEIDSIGNGGVSIKESQGKTILGERYNIYKYNLFITDNGYTSIVGSSISNEKQVVARNVEDNTYLTLNLNGSDLNGAIGRNVTAYLKNEDYAPAYDVIWYELSKKVAETVVYSQSIVKVTSSYIEYEPEPGSGITKKLNFSKSPYVIYNGIFINRYNTDIFKTKDGILYAVDNDGNNQVDLIEFYSFNFKSVKNSYGDIDQSNPAHNIVVDNVDIENSSIYCKNNTYNNLDLKEEVSVYRIHGNKKLEDIKEDMIVSVAKAPAKINGKNYYTLFISDKVVSGAADAVDVNVNSIYTNGEEIFVSDSFTSVRSNYLSGLKSGGDIKALMDVTGKIAYIYDLSAITGNYAYLISAGIVNGAEETLKLKLFLKNGEIKEYEANSKLTVDGNYITGVQSQLAAISKRPENYEKLEVSDGVYCENSISRPLIFQVNSEERIVSVDTDVPNYPTSRSGFNIYSDQNAIGYSDEEIYDPDTLKAAYRSHKIGRFDKRMGTLSQKFFIDSQTVIMKVPDIDTSGLNDFSSYVYSKYSSNNIAALDYKMIQFFEEPKEDENYKIMNFNDLSESMFYDIQGYNINPDTGVAELVIIRGKSDMVEYTSGDMDLCIFLRKTKAYDESKGKMVDKIYYTIDGINELSALIDPDELLFAYDYIISGSKPEDNYYGDEIPEISRGDMIRIVKEGSYLSHIERVFILDTIGTMPASITYPTITAGYRNTSTSANRLYDVNSSYRQINTTYNLYAVYPKTIKNGFMYGYMGTDTIGEVKEDDVKTFTDHYFKLNNSPIVLIDYTNPSNIIIKEGKLSDIKTSEQNGGSLEGTSLVLYKHINYDIRQVFVINGLR